jgi:uncharacterized protein (TIGR00299 family) protein
VKTLLLESVAGIAGDMFAAAFIDAGLVDPDAVRAVPGQLGIRDVEVTISDRTTASMRATHVQVKAGAHADYHVKLDSGESQGAGHSHAHTAYRDIDRVIKKSDLATAAKEFAGKVFALLAEAEADAHGIPVDQVHFHEVGAVDSVVDVALAGLCVSAVAPDRVLATPVKLGRGSIQIQHGVHAVPPPATARLAEGFPIADVPAAITKSDIELSTPTGLAILKALAPTFVDSWPAGTLRAQGMGSGTKDLGSYPNVFRVALFDTEEAKGSNGTPSTDFASDTVTEICFNIDDEPGERVGWITEQLRDAGAVDVWSTNIVGKKGRPAVQISVLAVPEQWAELADWILRNTSTFGLRYRSWDRLKLERSYEVRQLDGQDVRFKIGQTTTGNIVKEKPEYEDLKHVWKKGST